MRAILRRERQGNSQCVSFVHRTSAHLLQTPSTGWALGRATRQYGIPRPGTTARDRVKLRFPASLSQAISTQHSVVARQYSVSGRFHALLSLNYQGTLPGLKYFLIRGEHAYLPEMSTPDVPPLAKSSVFIIRSSINISAPKQKVWEVLLDFPSYGEWCDSQRCAPCSYLHTLI